MPLKRRLLSSGSAGAHRQHLSACLRTYETHALKETAGSGCSEAAAQALIVDSIPVPISGHMRHMLSDYLSDDEQSVTK
jgi:hypothetical protein